jgi:hypothetical protein
VKLGATQNIAKGTSVSLGAAQTVTLSLPPSTITTYTGCANPGKQKTYDFTVFLFISTFIIYLFNNFINYLIINLFIYLFILLYCLGAVAAPASPSSNNLLPNGGYENGSSLGSWTASMVEMM